MEPVKDSRFQVAGKFKVVNGSILNPEHAGLRMILSTSNMLGKPEGNPLTPTFDKKWSKVKLDSRSWFVNKTGKYALGAVETTAVQSDTWVMHMLCQDDKFEFNVPALETCLKEVLKAAKYDKASVHVSSILLDKVPELKGLLNKHMVANGVNVYLYEEKVT